MPSQAQLPSWLSLRFSGSFVLVVLLLVPSEGIIQGTFRSVISFDDDQPIRPFGIPHVDVPGKPDTFVFQPAFKVSPPGLRLC